MHSCEACAFDERLAVFWYTRRRPRRSLARLTPAVRITFMHASSNAGRWQLSVLVTLLAVVALVPRLSAEEADDLQALERSYPRQVQPLIARYCHECHAGDTIEGELDLSTFRSLADIRRQAEVWQKVGEMLDSEQMPPKDSPQPSADERKTLQTWVRRMLTIEAAASAGDPGPVVLRRLNNAEYTYTLRDLTGVDTLDPAREFPADSAAGEGFTNVGNALVMSPSLLTKYLDAAKEVASHAVLVPDGLQFSPSNTRRDWTNESLARIRQFYGQYASDRGGSPVNLQGVQFLTNQGGRLPIDAYLRATLEHREELATGRRSPADVARERGLSPKYLTLLWQTLHEPESPHGEPLKSLQAAWRTARPDDVPELVRRIEAWQGALWKFNSVGHIGRAGSAKMWQEPVSPIVTRQDFRLPMPAGDAAEVTLYLAAGDAGDGANDDVVVWERPRFVAPGRPELLLRDVRRVAAQLAKRRERHIAQAAACLQASAEAAAQNDNLDLPALAKKHGVEPEFLADWLKYLGIRGEAGKLGTPLERKGTNIGGYEFIRGWVGDDALSVLANASDEHVRIPGNMQPHSIAVHPAPKFAVAVGWKSPVQGVLKVEGLVQHAHPECGNGVAWSLELRRGNLRQALARGTSQGSREVPVGPVEKVAVQPGDVISLVIDPRDGNHSCDLTRINLSLAAGEQTWNLDRDVSPDILAGNPHADSHGNKDVWHLYFQPTDGSGGGAVLPPGSLLARWQIAEGEEKRKLSLQIQELLQRGPANLPVDAPDAILYRQLTSLSGPLLASALQDVANNPVDASDVNEGPGLDTALFGKHPRGSEIDAASLCVQAPTVLEVRVPAALVAGAEFVTGGTLDASAEGEGSVQLSVATSPPPNEAGLRSGQSIVVRPASAAQKRLEQSLDEFRQLFPAALCYTQIVPVDEVVTLTLYYREDDHLRRLMLDEAQTRELDRMWDQLLFIAQEPLEMVTAFDQLAEFATQDRPDIVKELEPLRQPVHDRAAKFRQRMVDCEPKQLDALLSFADRAWRRPLTMKEQQQLRGLYTSLREQELSHDEALRLTLARVLVAPAFLYRLEEPGPGSEPVLVSDWELASRLSYFLWSSAPDDELRSLAAAGKLQDPDVLAAQARRMLRDPKARRLATEFACQWLQIYNFDKLDEKSERHFPTFPELRGAMYEESIQFLTDLFQNDRSVLNLIDADYTFLNEALARHYGIPGVEGSHWRRVDGVRPHGRGGVLAQGAILAKQSGASRTSPILRGTWLSDVLLGEKLPRPPKDVPVLADNVPEGLTERQLTERHSSDPACAGCHRRIDPFGFALESYDAIGRFREKDAGGLAIDTKTVVPDGTPIEGLAGLQKYLLTTRRPAIVRQFNRKLIGYALGRGVRLSDEPLLDELQQAMEQNDYRVGTAIEAIVRSPQFRHIRGREAASE